MRGSFFPPERFLLKGNTSFLRESGNKVNPSWPKNKYTLQFAVVTREAAAPWVPQEGHVWIVRHFYFSTQTPPFV